MVANSPYPKLRGRMVEKNITQRQIADVLDISLTAVSNKLRGNVGFSQKDIIQICQLLDIPVADIGSYFYENNVYGG